MNHRLFLAVLFIFCAIASIAQVPIIVEPKPFQFELYHTSVINNNPKIPKSASDILNNFNIPSAGASSEEMRRRADEDIRQYQQQERAKQEFINQANKTLDESHINYKFPFEELPEKEYYYKALAYFKRTLEGTEPLNLEAAVFIVEHAFDPSLSYADFNQQLTKATNVIGLKMQQDKITATDNVGKIMTIFQHVSDTISVFSKKEETTITSYPKTYDFEDFWGQKDYRKMFVSKLMKQGSGQCHSLPLYFLILCERIGAQANMAFAPNHSFIKFQDKRGGWHNIELTNGMLASDHFMVESGYIKAEAIQSGIYLEPLTKKETIVQCLNDLTLGYLKKFGYDQFVLACTELAISHDPNSLSAHQINANYYMTLDNYIRYQFKAKRIGKEAQRNDVDAQRVNNAAIEANELIVNLGYSAMPPEVYAAWLKSAQTEARRQQHLSEIKVLIKE